MNEKKVITFYTDFKIYNCIKNKSEKEKRSISNVVNLILENYFENQK